MLRCLVPKCTTVDAKQLLKVPRTCDPIFKEWKKYLRFSGASNERVCTKHFRKLDINSCTNRRLAKSAVPYYNLPSCTIKIELNAGINACCVKLCHKYKQKTFIRFPEIKNRRTRTKWFKRLGIEKDCSTKNLRICQQHFKSDDYETVEIKTLKKSAVPKLSKLNLVPYVPNRIIHKANSVMLDHDYALKIVQNRTICSVYGCHARAVLGVVLHKFPARHDKRFNIWVNRLKFGKKVGIRFKVCSLHFMESDYITGTKRLKCTAIPSLNLPASSIQAVKKKARPTQKTFDDHNNSNDAEIRDLSENSHNLGNNQEHISWPEFRDREIVKEILDDLVEYVIYVNDMKKLRYVAEEIISEEACNGVADVQITEIKMKTIDSSNFILPDLILNDKDVNVWTGLPSLICLEKVCLSVKIIEEAINVNMNTKMHTTDRVILVLVKIKQNLSYAAMATLFKITAPTVAKYFTATIFVLKSIMKKFIEWPSKEEISKNIPMCFRLKFSSVRCVLDCTEVEICSLDCINCRIATYSHYKSRNTAKFLVSVTPAGTISRISHAYSGKASDKFIFNHDKFIEILEPHVDSVMVDKGFAIENELLDKGIRLIIPPFLRTPQLSRPNAIYNEQVAKARIHVERVIQRMKIFNFMQQRIAACMLPYLDDIMDIICGIVNLSSPVLSDERF